MLTRAVALFAAVLLFNQSVFAIDRDCRDATANRSHATGHEHHAPSPEPAHSHGSHAKCCDALSSCGLTIVTAGLMSTADVAPASSAASVSAAVLISSAPLAPETPPPKR